MTDNTHTSLTTFHPLKADGIVLPRLFNNPFHYTPHQLCIIASEEVKAHIASHKAISAEAEKGKMFGVLVGKDKNNNIGFLAAFSGILCGKNTLPYFVPPVYDLQNPDGHFAHEERNISDINHAIDKKLQSAPFLSARRDYEEAINRQKSEIASARQHLHESKTRRDQLRASSTLSPQAEAALIKESQHAKAEFKRLEHSLKEQTDIARMRLQQFTDEIEQLKQERKTRSASLQQWLFQQFVMSNALGEKKNLLQIFHEHGKQQPPAGSGECCAPKLLHHAYTQGIHPLCMAEFWFGQSPKEEIRHHATFYPSCTSKCKPILCHMLKGLDVEENQQTKRAEEAAAMMRIIYEDQWLCAIDKPAGMLTVPSKEELTSVYSRFRQLHPTTAPNHIIVHRLDMDTSGVLLLAKDPQTHKALQQQFLHHDIKKTYIAIVQGIVEGDQRGTINLPLSPDPTDRPRQKVDTTNGKQAITHYEVTGHPTSNTTRIAFRPTTGRTHQLRVHSAHPQGLAHPIVGDPLYGSPSTRMLLHAESIQFTHPATHQCMTLSAPCPF